MEREICLLPDQREVNRFLARQPRSSFLQTPVWATINYKQFWLVGAYEGEKLVGALTVGNRSLPMGYGYLVSARGPVIDQSLPVEEQRSVQADLLRWFDKDEEDNFFGANPKSSFVFYRFDPLLQDFNYADFGAKPTKPIQPTVTTMLNLNKPKEDLLSAMRQKTRYNIRLAEKKGVTVRKTDKPEDMAAFLKLIVETAKRDSFRNHPEQHYWDLFNYGLANPDVSSEELGIELWLAEYRNEPLAGALIAKFGDAVTYLHGGSNYALRDLMGPYLLHWRITEAAKDEGRKWYDLYGITLGKDPKHSWAGITRFKTGFGGETVAYPGTFDMVYDALAYRLYHQARVLRRLLPF